MSVKSLEMNRTTLGYFRCTGTRFLKNGVNTQKVFSLGKDRAAAEEKLIEIEYRWKRDRGVDANGKKVWSESGLQGVLTYLDPPKDENAPEPVKKTAASPALLMVNTPTHPTVPNPITTLYAGMAEFMVATRKRVSSEWADDIEDRLNSIKRHIPDCNLATVDDSAMDDMRLAIIGTDKGVGRPERKRQVWIDDKGVERVEKSRGIISLETARNWLMVLGMVFDYFDSQRRIIWAPENKKWREKFQLSKNDMKRLTSPDEQYEKVKKLPDGRPKDMFTLDEVSALYKAATPRQRMYTLFGILIGFKNKDIADLRRYELVTRNGESFIVKDRGKTGVPMDVWIAPELLHLIQHFADTEDQSPKALLFRTDERYPLVHDRTDNVRPIWERLMYKVTTNKILDRQLPFSSLRRLGAQMVENMSSKELAQVLLAHADGSVARENYIGLGNTIGVGKTPFERLHEVQREIHKLLVPMLDPTQQKSEAA